MMCGHVPPIVCQAFTNVAACLQDLLLSYNIGVDRVATRQQQLQRSARSVGWDLPDHEEEDAAVLEDRTRV